MAGLAEPGGGSGVEVDIADQQVLAKLGAPGDRPAGVIDDAGVTVEHELVLTADEPAEGHAGQVVAGALGEHALPLGPLPGVIGRRGDVGDQGGARQRLVSRGWAGLPDVLAHRQPDAILAQLKDGSPGSGLEVAMLVEHAVVG